MAKIIYVCMSNKFVRRLVLWRVYQRLAKQTTKPHTLWLRQHPQTYNVGQSMVRTATNMPCTFKALLEIGEHCVGIVNVSTNFMTIRNAIQCLEQMGAEVIVCGIDEAVENILHDLKTPPTDVIFKHDIPTIQPEEYPSIIENERLFNDIVEEIIEEIKRNLYNI